MNTIDKTGICAIVGERVTVFVMPNPNTQMRWHRPVDRRASAAVLDWYHGLGLVGRVVANNPFADRAGEWVVVPRGTRDPEFNQALTWLALDPVLVMHGMSWSMTFVTMPEEYLSLDQDHWVHKLWHQDLDQSVRESLENYLRGE